MKSPAFRFYPGDFLGSPDVGLMEAKEVGAYMLLLCFAWQSERHGYLPDDDDKLRRWARMSREDWAECRPLLLKKFPVVEAGWRANPRMVDEAEKQRLFSERQSVKGKKGGRPRKNPQLVLENPQLSPEKPQPRKQNLPFPLSYSKKTKYLHGSVFRSGATSKNTDGH